MSSLLKRTYFNVIKKPYYQDLEEARSIGILGQIRDTDMVYLFQNEYSIFFKDMHIPVIGTGHTFDIQSFVYFKDPVHRIYGESYYKKYFSTINCFNYFPRDKVIIQRLKDKWNLKYIFPMSLGVDTELFYPETHDNDRIKLLFVASLEYEKGLDILIPLMKKFINNDKIEFHIAGTGPLEDMLRGMEYIRFNGKLDNHELAKLYRGCDVFIYPSHNDTYSMVTLEALSSGLYVLEGDYLKGVFDDFSKYLEYIPMNVESFYNRINDIIINRKIIEHNKDEEYEYVKNNYDWSAIASKFYGDIMEIQEKFN
jgi:glycosyltransferase involved in cell wall biosynthesis